MLTLAPAQDLQSLFRVRGVFWAHGVRCMVGGVPSLLFLLPFLIGVFKPLGVLREQLHMHVGPH